MANNIFKELEKGSLAGIKRCMSLFPSAINTKNPAGSTPLHVAAALGQSASVKELLVHGAPHDVADSQGNLPLHLAAEQGSLDSVAELLTGPGRKLVVKAKNKDGQTPLHLAVRNGHLAVVAKLMDAGARTDAKDRAGNTPLDLVAQDDEELLQLLLTHTSTNQGPSNSANSSGGAASSGLMRVSTELTQSGGGGGGGGSHRPPSASGGSSGGGASTSRGNPMITPPASARGAAPGSARIPPMPSSGAGSMSSRMPRTVSNGAGSMSPAASVPPAAGVGVSPPPRSYYSVPLGIGTPGVSTPGVPVTMTPSGMPLTGTTVSVQLQKHDVAIQALQADVRAATERLGAVDACASAQLECAGQVERALASCGSHGRALSDLEARVMFQEDRNRDARGRLERLEEGERALQDSVSRLSSDQRGITSQLRELSEQVAAGGAAGAHRGAGGEASSQVQRQLQSEVAALRAQMEQLSPALVVATAASAEARALAARFESVQQQMQQQQHAGVGGGVLEQQQVLQLQAQVQLLQLPVATLTQQCADLSSRLAGLTEWQQQARAEMARIAEAAAAAATAATAAATANGNHAGDGAGGVLGGGELSETMIDVLETTTRTMAELRQQQDIMAKQIAALQQQQQQQPQLGCALASPLPSGTPLVPGTPNGPNQRLASMGGDAVTSALSGPPSRNLASVQSLGSMARDASLQSELRSEIEALKSQMADVKKEVASEGGSLRREWQRAFSDMQSRYGEQANELRAREQNIAKLREAALVEEAERRASSNFEDKVAKRLGKLETGIEYLTHRLEVLEEQMAGMAASFVNTVGSPPGALSPSSNINPAVVAATATAPLRAAGGGGQQHQQPSTHTSPFTGPGPVSENLGSYSPVAAQLAGAVLTVTPSLMATGSPLKHAGGSGVGLTTVPSAGPVAAPGGGEYGGSVRQHAGSQQHCPGAVASQEQWWQAACAPEVSPLTGPMGHVLPPPVGLSSPSQQQPWETSGLAGPRAAVLTGEAAANQSPVRPGAGNASGLGMGPGLSSPTSPREQLFSLLMSSPQRRVAGTTDQLQPQQQQLVQSTSSRAVTVNDGLQCEMQCWQSDAATTHGSLAMGMGTGCGANAAMLQEPMQMQVAAAASPSTPHGSWPVQGSMVAAASGSVVMCHAADSVIPPPLDPANVALGSQLLSAATKDMLAPSVDIQRLAAAAVAAQQQPQHLQLHGQPSLPPPQRQEVLVIQPHYQQQQLPLSQPQVAAAAGANAAAVPVAMVQREAGLAAGGGGARATTAVSGNGVRDSPAVRKGPPKEPPMCVYCSVQ